MGKMMEELSVTMQCDVCDVERMSEEEILACLVSDTEPKFTVRLFRDTDSDFSDPAGGFGAPQPRLDKSYESVTSGGDIIVSCI